MPDETLLLERSSLVDAASVPVRRFFPARDDALPLYVQEQGATVGRRGKGIAIRKGSAVLAEVRILDVSHVVLLGNIQVTAQALHLLTESQVPIIHLSMGHWFYGITQGFGLRNAFTKAAQFSFASDAERSLRLSRAIVTAKAKNQRTMLRRNSIGAEKNWKLMQQQIRKVKTSKNAPELLGMEGSIAAEYFRCFGDMLKLKGNLGEFEWTNRNRRPPKDPVNAMLSFGYAILAKECAVALLSVGLDPHWGIFHQPRHGRPSLALDLMEEFRPLIVDSCTINAVNSRAIGEADFQFGTGSCVLTARGRKAFIRIFEARLDQLVTHPVFDYRCSWRRVIAIQAQLMARHIRGEIPEYTGMTTR